MDRHGIIVLWYGGLKIVVLKNLHTTIYVITVFPRSPAVRSFYLFNFGDSLGFCVIQTDFEIVNMTRNQTNKLICVFGFAPNARFIFAWNPA